MTELNPYAPPKATEAPPKWQQKVLTSAQAERLHSRSMKSLVAVAIIDAACIGFILTNVCDKIPNSNAMNGVNGVLGSLALSSTVVGYFANRNRKFANHVLDKEAAGPAL